MYAIFVTLFLELQNENIKYFKQIIKCQMLILYQVLSIDFQSGKGTNLSEISDTTNYDIDINYILS